jgi:tetratricopeptide (TPR) repeat protein
MISRRPPTSATGAAPPRSAFRPIEWLAAGAWIYFALVGGTAPGEVEPVLRLINAGLAIGLIVAWVRVAPRDADRLDRFALLGLLLFLAAAVLARSPRAAIDAALGATGYVALLYVTRTAMGRPSMRARIALWLGTAGTVLAVTYCLLWLLVWTRWLGAGQPASALLSLPLPAGPYAFKHNVALVCGLLIPFLWLLPADRPVRVLRVVGTVALALLLLTAGSRGLWLAGLAATVAAVALRRDSLGRRLNLGARSWRLPVAIGLVAVVIVFWLVPDLGRAIGDRVGNLLSLRARWDLWAASLREWQSAVVSGVGPGGWPVWLPQTGYFDLTTFSPRHPDSMPFQLLAEAGLLGVAAVAILAAGVVRALRRTPPTPSIWALAFLLAACVTANPTDLPFAVALGIAWLAIAVPKAFDVAQPVHLPSRWVSRAELALVGVLVAFVAASSWAGLLHEGARSAAESGDLDAARRGMELAVALDPGLALYHRELGALRLAANDLAGSAAQLQEAHLLDPADDITMAGLAVVLSLEGSPDRAEAAAEEAIRLRRSVSINHLVLAWVASRAGDATQASSALADALVDAPWLTGDSDWNALRGDLVLNDILRTAAGRSVSDTWGLASGNAVWLAAMSNQPRLAGTALAGAAQSAGSLTAVAAMFACDLRAADAAAAGAATAEAASPGYWVIRAMLDSASGRSTAEALRVVALLGSTVVTDDGAISASAFGARPDDQWVYRRVPILFSTIGPALPSDDPGVARWLHDPRGTARKGAPESRLAQCE